MESNAELRPTQSLLLKLVYVYIWNFVCEGNIFFLSSMTVRVQQTLEPLQGRIQDFQEGVPNHYSVKVCQKLHKNEEIWTGGVQNFII